MDGEDDDEAEGELENNRFDLTWKGHVWSDGLIGNLLQRHMSFNNF